MSLPHDHLSSPPQTLMRAILVSIPELSCPWEESGHQISGAVCQRYPRTQEYLQELPSYTPVRKQGKRNMAPGQGRLPHHPLTLCFRPSRVSSTSSLTFHPVSSWAKEPGLWADSHKKEHTEEGPGRTKHLILLGTRAGDD